MRVFMISDTHFGIYTNNMNKWQNMMEETFYNFVIPFLKENATEGDILIHLGDLFDNRTSINIETLNKVERILKKISEILPIHILVGNHDLYNKGTNDINSVRIFSYMSDNINVYEKPHTIDMYGSKLVLMPWVEKRVDLISELSTNKGDYLFCHSDLNGCKMHLNSVAHRNPDKIDVSDFKNFKRVFSGHIHIRQVNKNFEFIGSLYQMDRNDYNDQKGITILNVLSGDVEFIPNSYSPVYKKVKIATENDISLLESLHSSKDYIDISISNNLLINNRKFRRKLESILESGNFASIEYIDDITQELKNEEAIVEQKILDSDVDVSIELDYEEYIKDYITKQEYDNDKFKKGILEQYNEVVSIFRDSFK